MLKNRVFGQSEGGIRSDGDVVTEHGSINNSRQVLRCESGNTIEIKYPSIASNLGGNIISTALDNIEIYMSYAPYGGGVYNQKLTFLYGSDIKAYFNLTSSTVNNSDGTTTLTISGSFSKMAYVQVEYTPSVTTVTVS